MTNAAEWLRKSKCSTVVGEFGTKVATLLDEWVFGIYHLHSPHHKRTQWNDERYIELVEYGELSTFDFDKLTRLVLLAHKHRIRVGIRGLANNYILMTFIPRLNSPENIYEHHPSLDDLAESVKADEENIL